MNTTPRNTPRKNPALPPERRWADVPGVKYPAPTPRGGALPEGYMTATQAAELMRCTTTTAIHRMRAAGVPCRSMALGGCLGYVFDAAPAREVIARHADKIPQAGPPEGYVAIDHAMDLTGWARNTLVARADRHGLRRELVMLDTPQGPRKKLCYPADDIQRLANLYRKGGKK